MPLFRIRAPVFVTAVYWMIPPKSQPREAVIHWLLWAYASVFEYEAGCMDVEMESGGDMLLRLSMEQRVRFGRFVKCCIRCN